MALIDDLTNQYNSLLQQKAQGRTVDALGKNIDDQIAATKSEIEHLGYTLQTTEEKPDVFTISQQFAKLTDEQKNFLRTNPTLAQAYGQAIIKNDWSIFENAYNEFVNQQKTKSQNQPIDVEKWKQSEEARGNKVFLINDELAKKIGYNPPPEFKTQSNDYWISLPESEAKKIQEYGNARAIAEEAINRADNGDIASIIGEWGQSLLGFGIADRIYNIATGNESREVRIERATNAILAEHEASGDFLKSTQLYLTSVGGVIGVSSVVGSTLGALYRIPLFRAPIVGYGAYSAIKTITSPETYTPAGAAATGVSFLSGGVGFKSGLEATASLEIPKTPTGKILSYDILSKSYNAIGKTLQPLKERIYIAKGMTEVPASSYIKETPSGFVKSTPSETLKAFQETGEFGHATAYRWRTGQFITARIPEGPREGEMIGLSVSPKGLVQPHFLRIDESVYESPTSSSVKLALFPKLRRPAIYAGKGEVFELPYSVRFSPEAASEFSLSEPGIYIAEKMYRGGTEPEAKISAGTQYKVTGSTEYFKYKDINVPVKEVELTFGEPKFSTKIKESFTAEEGVKYSYPISYSSLSTSYRFSSYNPSYQKISFTSPSYKSSKTSYPTITPPSSPRYKSSISIPSYTPSYKSTPSYPSYKHPSYPKISSPKSFYSPSISYKIYSPISPSYSKNYKSKEQISKKKKQKSEVLYRQREFNISPFEIVPLKRRKK